MNNLLAVDIGNTNITCGIFAHDKLIGKAKIRAHAYHSYGKNLKRLLRSSGLYAADINGIIISSVSPLALMRFLNSLKKIMDCNITIVGKDIRVPIRNLYRVKREVGQDRLVNALAAKTIYGAPAVIIDFGTAITFDLVSKKGEYLGGLILPGIELSLGSLYKNTALLPKVELEEARDIIGKDTIASMRGGILFGFGAMCDGLVAQYRKVLGADLKVIATGGNAKLMKKYARSIRIADEDITLKGLLLIKEVMKC